MSDNHKYYYIKLKDNYFDGDAIKILEGLENGHIYSLIILKLYVKSSKHNGRLMMTDTIPYDPTRMKMLAKVIGHDVDHLKTALQAGQELDLITIKESGEIWMTEMQNFIGHSSTEADRKRQYRIELKAKTALPAPDRTNVRTVSDKRAPELDLELKKESDQKRDYSFYKQLWDKATEVYSVKGIRSITSQRKRHLKARESENPDFREDFRKCMYAIGESKFLREWNNFGFDWIIVNDGNYQKILEGKYRDKPKRQPYTGHMGLSPDQ